MKLKNEIIGVIAASALVSLPVFANEAHKGSSGQGESQSSSSPSDTSAQGSAQQGASAASDPVLVIQVEEALNKKGYDVGQADGKMDQKTQDALSQFQQSQGLPATGLIDEQTLATLEIQPNVGAGQSGGSSGTGSSESSGSSSDPASSGASSGEGSGSSGAGDPPGRSSGSNK